MGLMSDPNTMFGQFMAAPEPRKKAASELQGFTMGRKPFNPQKAGIAETLLSFAPVYGDAQSGIDAAVSAKDGKYFEAALNGAGLLPFVPSLGKLPLVAGFIPPKGFLAPAQLRRGEVWTAPLGKTHYDVNEVEKLAKFKPGESKTAGWITSEGDFLNRADATAWLKANAPDTYGRLDSNSKAFGLESGGYNNAAGLLTEEEAIAREFMKRQFGM